MLLYFLQLFAALLFSFLKINLQVNGNSNYTANKSSTSNSLGNISNVQENKNLDNQTNSNTENTQSNSNNQGDINSNGSQNSQYPQSGQNTQNIQDNQNVQNPAPQEKQIATFSTKIYTHDSSRQNNMNITASRLNGHIVKNGEIFSFCNTLGPSSSKNGYQEADVYDNDGNKKKALGGGNCQISTTLYNAVLSVPSLKVIERHEHSNYVPYIKKGKDAAVAYGSYDFKFRNDTGKDIKLLFEVKNNSVTSSIIQIG